MKIGASTLYAINSKTVIESVDELEKAGFETIELVYEYKHLFGGKEIKILKAKDLDFSRHRPFIGVLLTHLNALFSAPQIQLDEKSLDMAAKIGCSYCVLHGGKIPQEYLILENPKTRDFFIDLFVERFQGVFQKYSKRGLKIIIENSQFDNQISGRPSDILRIQRA